MIRSDRINHFDYLEDDPDTVDPGNHGDNSSDENDDVVAIKTKRKRIIDEESDLSDGENFIQMLIFLHFVTGLFHQLIVYAIPRVNYMVTIVIKIDNL